MTTIFVLSSYSSNREDADEVEILKVSTDCGAIYDMFRLLFEQYIRTGGQEVYEHSVDEAWDEQNAHFKWDEDTAPNGRENFVSLTVSETTLT